ncbi:MAG: hypothetical protein QW717_05335 [Candidatus Bathyarchaeia archaeon]
MAGLKSLKIFAELFGAKLNVDERLVVEKDESYFLLNREIKETVEKNEDWLHAGIFLGRFIGGKLRPSFPFLLMLGEKAENKITLDDKAAWLFICGRDIFREGILKVEGSTAKNAYTLIFNKHGECLGYGRIAKTLHRLNGGVAVKNILDIGDFLRRERQLLF